eukprot:Gregarina_sp_Pseudo_9__5776@NODE_85_length_4430_cov_44_276475_g77_i0_p3_GENE_NODE_85_length_4430_cov_44_276475_g77_i0NODE_85_length_4430_cov_44_276475_g77_i0_p3_ORF_typecomplete_len257_score23_45Ubiquitin_2/PF14560_6/9_5e16CAP_GLY/PF01302_25/7_7e08ubiquitin/PF00240_23/0_004DUF1040/PF06288_13/6_8e03DUF1040/PF06288_13/0_23_NODE_85_length_4430_cov_44_276475_g77_i013982168
MTVYKLDLTHQLVKNRTWAEIRFDSSLTLSQAKDKISHHVGSAPSAMRLEAILGPQRFALTEDFKSLEELGVQDGMRIHIYDDDPNSMVAQIERDTDDISSGAVKKFELTDSEYAKKSGTAREFLSKLKGQRPDLFKNKESGTSVKTEALQASDMPFSLGSRCEVKNTSLRGKVAWIGQISDELLIKQVKVEQKSKKNMFCGILLDNAFGNFDGKDVDGTVLFECDVPRRGLLVHVDDLNVGDAYVPIDPFDMDEI